MDIVAPVVGATIGFFVGGPAGAQAGWVVGSAIGGLLGPRPKGPGPGDLSAPRLQLGSPMPRPYGRVRLAVNPISISAYRATAQESGGKGSPSQVTGYTYDIDVYGIVADTPVIPVIAVVREWHNKELIFTALADSTDDSVVASADNGRYASVADLFGGVLQDPAPLYEDRVGTVNAPANILMHTREYAGLQCGSTKTLPQIEVEVITAGTPSTVDATNPPTIVGTSEGDDLSPALPGGVAVGDGIVLIIHCRGFPTVPGGYTLMRNDTASGGGSTIYLYGRTADGTATDANMDFTMDIGGNDNTWAVLVVRADADSNFPATLSSYITFVLENSALDPGNVTKPSGTYQLAIVGAYIDRGNAGGGGGIQIEAVPVGYTQFCFNDWAWDQLGTPHPAQTMLGYKIITGTSENPGAFDDNNGSYGNGGQGVFNMMITAGAVSSVTAWTPLPVTLASIITAELSLYPEFDPASIDVTDIAGIDVTGFTAVGDPARNVAELCDMFYVGVVPGYPVKFVQLGAAVVGAIPFADTGAGAGQPGESFHGLDQGDNDEISGVKAIRYPSIGRDHNPDFRRGDRLTTDGPDVQATETRVVFTDAEAKGRAITATLMARDAKDTAEFAVSDKYAAAEPIDCYTVTDREGNSYRLRIDSLTYADGVKSCRWTKDEPASLVQSGLTDLSNTPGIEVAPPPVATLYLLDIPILRDTDNNYGLYACCTAEGTWSGGRLYRSTDDATYTEVAAIANRATAGLTSGALATYTGWTWDDSSTLTVTLDAGSGGVLTSATKTAIEASETLNAAAIGVHGRWELVRFSTATLVTGTTYLLSGFLRGQKGTEPYNGTHAAGDKFVLLQEAGMARINGAASDIGVVRYYKAVPNGRSPASYAGTAFTTAEQGLMPYAPVDLWNDAGTLRWNRRSRLSAAVGLDPPLGEDSESYAVELDGVETDTVSTNAWTPVAPVSGETLLVAQRSAQVGAGHEASKAIT